MGTCCYEIRKMKIQDYEQVYQLWINTPGMGLNELDDSKEGIDKYLKRNPDTCFIALQDNQVIGVILSGHDGRRGFIHHTAVLESYRKQGVGTALVQAAMKALEEQHINKVALVAFSKNTTGNAFWEKQGFTERNDLTYRNRNIRELNKITCGK
jgi:ribosomal protein S18 acetylase RimI-like enzyme